MSTNNISIDSNDLVQSDFTYIQAAGSDGADGSTFGVHLRWTFRNELGESHLPKGNLAQSGSFQAGYGFNKANDFIEVFRVPYANKHMAIVDLKNAAPTRVLETGSTRYWEYDIPMTGITQQSVTTTVQLSFTDTAQYDSLRYSLDPATQFFQILQGYTGLIEMRALGKLSFAASFAFELDGQTTGTIRAESVSAGEDNLVVTCRRKFTCKYDPRNPNPHEGRPVDERIFENAEGEVEKQIIAENIEYVRFDYREGTPIALALETYFDFILGSEDHQTTKWQKMDDYALTNVTSVAHQRLENGSWNINQNWPRFNQDAAVGTNGARVVVANYQDKWDNGVSGDNANLRIGVEQYLNASSDTGPDYPNPTGTVALSAESDGSETNTAQMPMNTLEMLNFVALDYHVARMLGLGTIDHSSGSTPYVYLMRYVTYEPLPGVGSGEVVHYYMTLPTAPADQRLPEAAEMEAVKYGLTVPAIPEPLQITDDEGYVPYEPIRYIRLYRSPDALDLTVFRDFFDTPDEFCIQGQTTAVYYGLEYRNQGGNWVWPELSNDEEYQGADGENEVMPLARQVSLDKPIFIHEELTEGFHDYALYGINWFSRPGPLGTPVSTDLTSFNKFVEMLPPANLQAHLVQKETPLIFTTAQEQATLAGLSAGPADNDIMVRVAYEWNHIHNMAYQQADTVEFFFRQAGPDVIQGEISNVVDLADHRAEVTLISYVTASTGETIKPIVTQPTSNFAGAVFSVAGSPYFVESITTTVDGSDTVVDTLIIRKNQETEQIEDPPNSNNFIPTHTYESPAVGALAMLTENLSVESNWPGATLTTTMPITNFTATLDEDGNTVAATTYQETVVNTDGSTEVKNMGGIVAIASVTEKEDVDGSGTPIASSKTGVYEIEFTGNPLPSLVTNLEWFKGTIRIREISTGPRKELNVIGIEVDTMTGNLKLMAVDYSFDVDVSYNPINGYVPIETGATIQVNFHPGYKAYLFEQSGLMDQAAILPVTGEGTRTTYLTVRAKDTVSFPACDSRIASPVVLQAREIIVPLPPELPTGPLFATRPDRYGKSTYTFDTEFQTNGREPFGMIFYRASELSVLEKLYSKPTIAQIKADLEGLTSPEADFINDRWSDLVNMVLDTGTDEFRAYGGGTYRLPNPDNDNYRIPDTRPGQPPIYPFPAAGTIVPGDTTVIAGTNDIVPGGMTFQDAVRRAIYEAFLPMTEQPAIYQQIPDGSPTANQTSNRKPKYRDENGKRYVPSDPNYDPMPMAVVIPDKSDLVTNPTHHTVRFSDYTLDGSSSNIYFYYAVEMSNNFELSDPSPVSGPIRLVNTIPAEPPQIQKVTSVLENPLLQERSAVKFEVNPYAPSEKIKYFMVYRATNKANAQSIQTMTPVRSDLFTVGEQLIDTFSEESFPLFGETLFYRIVAFREITNEQDELENVPSEPSPLAVASLVDVNNPAPPELAHTYQGLTTGPKTLVDVRLSWNKTTHNGTYYLYKEVGSGNWQLVSDQSSNENNLFASVGDLVKEDEDGNTVYHRFKVHAENSSGLLNTKQQEYTI